MKDFDKSFCQFLERNRIPGAALTVAYKGKIIFSRGYGWADKEEKKPVLPSSAFRVASLSKSITAVGILNLCEKGKLDLEQKAFSILSDFKPCDLSTKVDQRIYSITIRELLQCSAGWNHVGEKDPIFGKWLGEVAGKCSNTLRPTNTAIIRYLLKDRLDYDPGTNHIYSNVSYCILGAIIEKVTGRSYKDYINELIAVPEHLNSMKQGSTLATAKNEVNYYTDEGERNSILPNLHNPVSVTRSGFFVLEAAPASIGWIVSTEDLVRFLCALSGESSVASPIGKESITKMVERPDLNCWQGKHEYFGMGWEVERDAKDNLLNYSRHGSLPGSMALMENQSNGISWAAAFNSRPLSYELSREEVKKMIKNAIKNLVTSASSK